jgi:predicted Fe-S protein YdhL (DUF1289 family)
MEANTESLAALLCRTEAACRAQPVPSPCRNVCRMDGATGYCEGCLRTIDEIAGWSARSEQDKRAIWLQLAGRAERLWQDGENGGRRP